VEVAVLAGFCFLGGKTASVERSNIPIRDVVGGIDVVSNTSSWPTCLETLWLLETDCDRPDVLDTLSSRRTGRDCSPVWFGLVGADLDAARLAAICEGDLDRLVDPGN